MDQSNLQQEEQELDKKNNLNNAEKEIQSLNSDYDKVYQQIAPLVSRAKDLLSEEEYNVLLEEFNALSLEK
ncbi:MAG: hypothetical protein HOL80_01590 [Candidatus Magasanikbacteria bacterium]|jgi:hypothetical protein|nr:hypothetical protein [Candidatus Magasanikbacteria bacterium]MBT5262574.1 hypothetical protein [Candidatus Magasanikbacteria bacterium]MBT5819951.1 hypothetical protein [Candidatus Magasanikbacteria bacterium]MBT6294135.1 hypothetical protein [Candidatus Magasanikbacteria bacterium]